MRMHEIDGGRRHDRRKADVLGTRDVCPARDELCHVDDVLDVIAAGIRSGRGRGVVVVVVVVLGVAQW